MNGWLLCFSEMRWFSGQLEKHRYNMSNKGHTEELGESSKMCHDLPPSVRMSNTGTVTCVEVALGMKCVLRDSKATPSTYTRVTCAQPALVYLCLLS